MQVLRTGKKRIIRISMPRDISITCVIIVSLMGVSSSMREIKTKFSKIEKQYVCMHPPSLLCIVVANSVLLLLLLLLSH